MTSTTINMKTSDKSAYSGFESARRLAAALLVSLLALPAAHAQDTVCARVKIEIKQELTLERQGFDAEMKINNTTDSGLIENVGVVVKVTDENGVPVTVTDDPNNLSAKFFLRLASKENIANVDGSGVVAPKTTGTITWLLIPAPGAAGTSALGKKYLVGATLKYKFGGEDSVLEVDPDVITVKPLPLLTLDYFLTKDVEADDPLTPAVEPAEPFTLGVRVKNTGLASAKNLKIDSAQPKIVENIQGLLINFTLTGSYVNDAPTQNSLLINFGDIAGNSSKMGRWIMQTTLAGKFTEFTARFTHADELGGALTSILQAANAHFLIRDVRVDLPGRDYVRDFLARDGDVIRVYESDGMDTIVTDRSAVATLTASGTGYRLAFPATAGFAYVRLPDPFNGSKVLGAIVRSDAKQLASENVWLSRTRNEQSKEWEYWVNFFDVNTTGVYDSQFDAPSAAPKPPVLQLIADRTVQEGKQVSFVVEASSPDGKPVTISAAPLPAGATFTAQAPNAQTPGLARSVFDWTPPVKSAGSYPIVFSATDGAQGVARTATIKVEAVALPVGPGTPAIDAPLSGAQVTSLKPQLSVQTSAQAKDPTTQVQFEVYADEAATQLVATALVDKVPSTTDGNGTPIALPTSWTLPAALNDNSHYWWRARAFDGNLYSPWINGRFFVNAFNDAPDSFNLTSPPPGVEVASLTPVLAWTNSSDKDGDAISYGVTVFSDAALTEVVAQVANLPGDASGITSWTVPLALNNHGTYYWRAIATDALGARTPTAARPFVTNTGNSAPTAPILLSPAANGESAIANPELVIQNSIDADSDLLTYVFEIDTVNTFDSGDKRSSGQVIQSGTGSTRWAAAELVENKRYWWRVKAQDGRAESDWVVGHFLMNAVNDAPPAPTVRNPGNGAWTATQQPSLEANPVTDPEGEAVRYQFEVYMDAGLSRKVAEATSTNTAAVVPVPLADKTTHWWRVRALDAHEAASAWSAAAVLYVSTAPFQDPTIALTSPAAPVVPDTVQTPAGVRKQVTLRWEGTDPNIEPTVALYYSASKSDFAGNLIVDGLRQGAGRQTGSYVWDVTALPPGAYYVYAVIYDAKGMGKAYAPGAVVIPNATQSGSILVTAGNNLRTSEDGKSTAFNLRLSKAPLADVVLPLSTSNAHEGVASPASLTFTRQNWSVNQAVLVTGQNDCARDGNQVYQVFSGKAQSVDPDYIGVSGKPVSVVNMDSGDSAGTTSNPALSICGFSVVSERKVDNRTWEYTLKAELTNSGAAVGGVTATLRQLSYAMERVDDTLIFGAVAQGETAKTSDTVTVRARFPVPSQVFTLGIGFKWNVVVKP
jgi:Putative Ig domain